jgi:membrane protein CcdC involved in cytochrome C biogenesis
MPDSGGLPLTSIGAAIVGALFVLAWRIRESQRAVTTLSIVIPPLGMSTGFSMFAVPAFRVPLSWGVSAFVLGALVFAYPLLATTRLRRDGDVIMMRRSRAFIFILLGLVAARLLLRDYVGTLLPPTQTAGLFFILAFGMIVRWRSAMFVEYRRLVRA